MSIPYNNRYFTSSIYRLLVKPTVLWLVVTMILIFFCRYVIDTDAIFDATCDLNHEHGAFQFDEMIVTYTFLSVGWLIVAFFRGFKLRKEINRRKIAEASALRLARHDTLTGALNRRAFIDEVDRTIKASGEHADTAALLLIDLDDFKSINDIHSHASGDKVLQLTLQRLKIAVGKSGLIARLGGDEFAVLTHLSHTRGEVNSFVERLSAQLQQPISWEGATLFVGASIGVSIFPDDGYNSTSLLHSADIAMYRSKQEQKGSYRFFEAAMEAERVERRRREEELRSGIAGGEVQPFYQPIVRFSDDHLCGFEILARWHHPKLGILPPSEFIQLAENTRQITALTDSVLRQACRDIRSMPSYLRFAINLSPTQLAEPEIAERLISIVQNAGIEPRRIEIELTEDAIMDDVQVAEVVIGKFRDSGMSIALDDFGTGFSSLSNLRKLRFDKLKIDKSFVQTIIVSEESQKLVDAILGLAASFNMTVTAEGIETREAAEMLVAKGCPQGQGYFFSRPLPFSAAHELASKVNFLHA